MRAKRAPRLAVAVLDQLLGHNEPLVGDLLEECPHRSHAWFWRQVTFAVLTRAIAVASATVREPQRLGRGLASVAMVLVLCFQTVVAGSLLEDVITRMDSTRATRIAHPEWMLFVGLLSLAAAWIIGQAVNRLHRHSRVATILVCGVSAAVVASVTVSVLREESSRLFFPSAALQTAAAMVFVLGLLVGGGCSSLRDRRAASRPGR